MKSEPACKKASINDIIIVDDETSNLELLTQLLTRQGYKARPTKRPQMAIDSALAEPPRLILLDVKMPEMDGFEICRRLKQDERTRDIPIIFISALQDVQDRVRGFEAGGVDFISKPFQEEEVLARVRTHIDLRTMQLSLEEMVAERTAELSESESRFRSTFEQAAVGIAHVSPDGHFLRINRKWCDIVGYSHEEMRGLTFQDLTHPDDLAEDLEYVRQVLKGELETYSMEKRYVCKSGQIVWIDLTVSLVRNEAGQSQWFVSVINDISDRKKAGMALREQEATLRTLLNAPLEVIMLLNRDGTILSINEGGAGRFGKRPEAMIGHTIYQSMPDEVAQLRKHYSEEVFATGKAIHFEDKREDTYFTNSVYPVFDAEGEKVVSIAVFSSDITERKRDEKKLSEYQQRLRSLASELTITEARERRRIAVELHDGPAQMLAFSRIQLADACKTITSPATKNQLDEVSQGLRETLRKIRGILLDLSSPSMNELGLGAAVSEWIDEQAKMRHGLATEFENNCANVSLDDDVRAILFRNVRELITNSIKHAKAKKVSVYMQDKEKTMHIIVEDDGVGFDVNELTRKPGEESGFGLFSIRECMTDLGGSLKVMSKPGKGCNAKLIIPIASGKERN